MEIELVIFNPSYFIFSLGINLNRYIESDDKETWVRKELEIGLLLGMIRFHFYFDKKKRRVKSLLFFIRHYVLVI